MTRCDKGAGPITVTGRQRDHFYINLDPTFINLSPSLTILHFACDMVWIRAPTQIPCQTVTPAFEVRPGGR